MRFLVVLMCGLLIACGGGNSSNRSSTNPVVDSSVVQLSSSSFNSASVFFASSSSSVSSLSNELITISGKITYDFVPHNTNHRGLNYAATEERPGRGLVVELLDQANNLINTGVTDNLGNYSLQTNLNQLVRVSVKAQLQKFDTPTWKFSVTDNTNRNSLYVMQGSLVAATPATAVRNLKANSGWGGSSYTQTRVAAPFAILDSVYNGIQTLVASTNIASFRPLELRWSTKNKTANGNIALGEIGTSFYDGGAIYILGDENNDIDEYDSHVILHEWGHYIEDILSRSDSPGGPHAYSNKLDMRLAMSEGFCNAFSALVLKDSFYKDVSGNQQASATVFNVARKDHTVRGYFSEASVDSVLYNFHISSIGKVAEDFSDILNILNAPGYKNSDAMTSIYVFANELRAQAPAQATLFDSLLAEQNIAIANEFGVGESNSGGSPDTLPIYKPIAVNAGPVNICSSNRFGSENKLGVSRFLIITINTAGNYQFDAVETGMDSGSSDPDIRIFNKGMIVGWAIDTDIDQEQLIVNLSPGTYVLEVVDNRAQTQAPGVQAITACFNVTAQLLN